MAIATFSNVHLITITDGETGEVDYLYISDEIAKSNPLRAELEEILAPLENEDLPDFDKC